MSYIVMKDTYRSADMYKKEEWGWRGIVDPEIGGGSRGLAGDIPLIDYSWSTSQTEDGSRVLDNKASAVEYQGDLYFGKAIKPNGIDQSFDINCIGATTLYVFKDGVLVSEDVSTIDTYIASENVAYSNAITTSQAFTDSQVEYLSKYPEKFLYHKKTVNADGSATWTAKSKILNQYELDNVVAHLPMCENDFYVRDMMGYGEGIDEVVNGTFDTDTDWNKGTGWSITNGTAIYDGSGGTSSIYISMPSLIIGDVVMVNIEVLTNSGVGTNVIDIGSVRFNPDNLQPGKYSFVGVIADSNVSISIYGRDGEDFEIDNISVKKLSNTTPITNPTSDMLLTNQTNGLQTCFLERDELGVVVSGSFDRLSCDGSGYCDTGWIPDSSKDYIVEFIMNRITPYTFSSMGSNRDLIRFYKTAITLKINDETSSSIHIPEQGAFHFSSHLYRDLNINKVYVNGEEKLSRDVSDGTLSTIAWLFNISLKDSFLSFKIHTTTQDPLKLYQDAQIAMAKKGITI